MSDVGVARGGLLPSVSFDYFYGINANQFAIYNPEGARLLGSVFQAQMTVPLWNWGASQSKLRQAHLRETQAEIELRVAQRQLQANISTFYAEAQIAQNAVLPQSSAFALSASRRSCRAVTNSTISHPGFETTSPEPRWRTGGERNRGR